MHFSRKITYVKVIKRAGQLFSGSRDTRLAVSGENVDSWTRGEHRQTEKPGHVFDVTRLLTRCPMMHWGGCVARGA